MSDEESKKYASLFFEGLGYSITSIPESKEQNEKRADLEVIYENETIIVEAKGRDPHKAYIELINEAKSQGIATSSRELISWNNLSAIIEKATYQLDATPAPKTAPHILFVSCLHNDWQFVFDSFKYRLYGKVDLILVRNTQHHGIRSCFYYDSADFLRYKTLDAVIMANSYGCQLFINEFGEKVSYLRKSKLYMELSSKNAVIDPENERLDNKVFAILADKKLNQKECWQYILDKYDFMTSPPMIHSHFYGIATI